MAPGLDPSWQSGLAEAFEHGLQWGTQVIFTFGPYGFVDDLQPFYRETALLAVLFALGVSWGTAALVVLALRTSWRLLPAGLVAWAVLALANSHTGYADLAGALGLGLALGALWAGSPGRRVALLALLGALGGFLLLTKFNDGLVCLGLLAVSAAGQLFVSGPRAFGAGLAAGTGAMAAGLLSAWVAAGQRLSNLGQYMRGSWAVAEGYSSAMGLSEGRHLEDAFAVGSLGLLAAVSFLTARVRGRNLSAGAKACLGVALTGWSWATLKEGFVRHDAHDLTFFGLVLVALALGRLPPRLLALQAGALAATACFFCVAAGAAPEQLYSPAASAGAIATELRAGLGLGGFSSAQLRLRSGLLRAGNALPPRALELVAGRSVAIEPALEAVAYTYERLRWDPEPVLQAYSAYTSYLDRLDASFLASARAPERIVYQPSQTIAGRDPWMGPPAALEAMYCHYEQLGVAGPWQVLARIRGTGRCSQPRLVGRVRARFGQAVAVPKAPHEMLVATFSFHLPFSYWLKAVALRAPAMYAEFWQAGRKRPAYYRFVAATGGDLHVLATPPSLGYSLRFTPPAVGKLAFFGGGWTRGHGLVTVSFYTIEVRPS